jgi:hypothetical protein
MGVSTFSGVSNRPPSFIPRSKAPIGLLGVAKAVCETSLFYVETMAISSIQLAVVFHLATTLCESGGTSHVGVVMI